jgi:hypothetical protein
MLNAVQKITTLHDNDEYVSLPEERIGELRKVNRELQNKKMHYEVNTYDNEKKVNIHTVEQQDEFDKQIEENNKKIELLKIKRKKQALSTVIGELDRKRNQIAVNQIHRNHDLNDKEWYVKSKDPIADEKDEQRMQSLINQMDILKKCIDEDIDTITISINHYVDLLCIKDRATLCLRCEYYVGGDGYSYTCGSCGYKYDYADSD